LPLLLGGSAWLIVQGYLGRADYAAAPSDRQVAQQRAEAFPGLTGQPAIVQGTPLDPTRAVRLAIGGLGLVDDERNRQLGDLLTAELTGVQGLALVERPALAKVLRELELNLSGLVRAKDAVRVGKLLRAECVLLGTATTLKGETSVVLRLVDARNGVIRGVAVFGSKPGLPRMAADMARFVRQCREATPGAKPRMFLAVGPFIDVGINSRQAAFANQLCAYLTTAYQGSSVTLLEREQVSALLQEVRLDLVGLADEGAAEPPSPMQSAFWLVDGFFQSVENNGYEVELALDMTRIFGRRASTRLHGRPEEAFFREVKEAIDHTLAQAGATFLVPTRRSELREQIVLGKELFRAVADVDLVYMLPPGSRGGGEQNEAKRSRYLTEACRALETALLLEPQNREARFFLSACYRDWAVGRYQEGESLLRELAASNPPDDWSSKARTVLDWSTRESDQELAVKALAGIQAGPNPILEERLFGQMQSSANVLQGKSGGLDSRYGLAAFVEAFGTNRAEAARRLVELLPRMRAKFPELGPHLLGAVVAFQVDTNAPVVAEFRKSLGTCGEHPEKVLGPAHYFNNLSLTTYNWCSQQALYSLAAEIGEARRRAAQERPSVGFDSRDKVRLIFAYLASERWQQALTVLEELGDAPIQMLYDGPWGRGPDMLMPAQLAEQCRAKLGLPPAIPAADRFDFGNPCLCLHTPSAIAVSDDTLWVAIAGQLLQLDLALKTNRQVRLPIDVSTTITALCVGKDRLWIGTDGAGLIEYDKAGGQCRRMTEEDGLLINHINLLALGDHQLWIGFGRDGAGGVGQLDLPSGHLSAFTPALPAEILADHGPEAAEGPPRRPVSRFAVAPSGDLWLLQNGTALRRYRPTANVWTVFPAQDRFWLQCFAVSGDRLYGAFIQSDYRGDLRWRSFENDQWQRISDSPLLPASPNLLILDGSDAWIGGSGFVAVVDLTEKKIRKMARIPADSVDHLAIAGGLLWVKFHRHLYRVPLSATR